MLAKDKGDPTYLYTRSVQADTTTSCGVGVVVMDSRGDAVGSRIDTIGSSGDAVGSIIDTIGSRGKAAGSTGEDAACCSDTLRKLMMSRQLSSNDFSVFQQSSFCARFASATQEPTSPGLRPTGLLEIVFCDAFSIAPTTSRTVFPQPVPRLKVRKFSFNEPSVALARAAMWPRARSETWMKSRTAVPSGVS
jgi:hypothetical protein